MSNSEQMPAAFYPDPSTPGQLRWWDGAQWTDQVSQPTYPVLKAGPNGKRYAGFWERFLAFLLDAIIIYVPLGIVDAVVGGPWIVWLVVTLVVEVLYFIVLIAKYGQTVGMRVLSIRVVTADGGLPGNEVAGKRWLLPGGLNVLTRIPFVPLSLLLSLIVIVDFLSMLWDPQNQCWHDKIAGTWVVHTTDAPAGAQSFPA